MAKPQSKKRKNLILWRHAEAQDCVLSINDFSRELTNKGQGQAAVMADWLKRQLAKDVTVLVSPAVRAQQTAQALHLPYQTQQALLPEATVDEVVLLVKDAFKHHVNDLLLVGHQPWLGQVVAHFLLLNTLDLSLQKSAVWWLESSYCHNQGEIFKLVAVLSPRFIADQF